MPSSNRKSISHVLGAFLLLAAAILVAQPSAAAELQRSELANGLEVLLKESHGGPMVASIVTVGAGARYEDVDSYGASHFLEHMCFNGTATRSREDINEGIKAYGGYINAFTRREYTCYILLIPTEYLREGLEIQADMLFGSLLDETEFAKEKLVVLEEMNKDYDSGSYRGDLHRNASILAGTPYAHPVLGSVETITNLDRDEVLSYYHERYQPSNSRLFLVGDFDRRGVMDLLDDVFGAHESAVAPPPVAVRPDWPAETSIEIFDAEEGEPRLDLYWLAPSLADGDHAAQSALAQMLSDEYRSPLLAGEEGLELNLGVDLFADFNLFNLTASSLGDESPAALAERVSQALSRLSDWVPDAEWTAEVAHGMRVDEIFLQDTYHYYAMMKSAELHLGGYPLLSETRHSLATLEPSRIRKALEQSLLVGSPRIIWSEVGADADAFADGPDPEAFRVHGKADGSAQAEHIGRPARRLNMSGGRPAGHGEKRSVLPNGLTVLLRSDPSSDVFAAHLLIRGRSALEPAGREGMVTLAHRLLEAGTEDLDEAAVSAVFSRLGAKLKTVDNPWIPFDNYYTREDFSFLRLEALDEAGPEAITLLATLIGEAAYPDAAVEREKGKMIGALSMGGSRPSGMAGQVLRRQLYGDNPRGRSLGGSAASLGPVTADELRDFHARYFDPGRMVLSIVSGLPLKELRETVRRSFGELDEASESLAPAPTLPGKGPVELSEPMDKAQVALLAARVLGPQDESPPELRVLVDVLSARMALELREKQGLAYSLGAGLRYVPGLAPDEQDFGLLTLRISTGAENREQARRGIMAELERMASEPPSEEEIFRAVNGRWGRELMRDLSRIHQAYRIGLAEHLGKGDPFDGPSREVASQRSVAPERLAVLARQFLLQNDWIWVQAGGGLQ